MGKMVNVLMVTALAAGCTPAESGKVDRPKPSKNVAPIPAVVEYDARKDGQPGGADTFLDPWRATKTGTLDHGETLGALCMQEGRQFVSEDVPPNVRPIDTTSWTLLEGNKWTPTIYLNLGGVVLPQCAAVGLSVPKP